MFWLLSTWRPRYRKLNARHKNFRGSDVSELSVYISFVAEVNGLNPEMKNLEMENVGGGKAGQAHIGSTLVETSQQVREGKERQDLPVMP